MKDQKRNEKGPLPYSENFKSFCFQSNDPRVKRKMARRNDFNIFNTWSDGTMVYITGQNNTQSAKRTLSRLTGQKVVYMRSSDVYMAESHTIVTSDEGSLSTITRRNYAWIMHQ